jgi:hypothetical protein
MQAHAACPVSTDRGRMRTQTRNGPPTNQLRHRARTSGDVGRRLAPTVAPDNIQKNGERIASGNVGSRRLAVAASHLQRFDFARRLPP